jgi:hypothetical protein
MVEIGRETFTVKQIIADPGASMAMAGSAGPVTADRGAYLVHGILEKVSPKPDDYTWLPEASGWRKVSLMEGEPCQ